MSEPTEAERLQRATELTTYAIKHVADSLTTIVVGIYQALGMTENDLHRRVQVSWHWAVRYRNRGPDDV